MSRGIRHGYVARCLALLGLAAYASAGLLGYGLHRLWSCDHAGRHCAESFAGGHDCGACGDHARRHPGDAAPRSASLGSSCHDCSICAFLAQAQTGAAPPPAIEGAEPLIVAAASVTGRPPAAPISPAHARGPPCA